MDQENNVHTVLFSYKQRNICDTEPHQKNKQQKRIGERNKR